MHIEYYIEELPVIERRGALASITYKCGDSTFAFVLPPHVWKLGCAKAVSVADDLFANLNVEPLRRREAG